MAARPVLLRGTHSAPSRSQLSRMLQLGGLFPVALLSRELQYHSMREVPHTSPSHALQDYVGVYVHPGYEIHQSDQKLTVQRNSIEVALEHLHFDTWVPQENEVARLHSPSPFDRVGITIVRRNESPNR